MVELTIGERLMLGMLLGPIAADVVTLRIVRDLQTEIGFSDEESEELKFAPTESGQIRWNPEAVQTREFDFKPAALRIIEAQLRKANANKTLTLQQLDLYDKFIPEEEV
jgi:hypothetical protein